MPLENARNANRLFIARLEAQTLGLQQEIYPGNHPGPYKWLKIVRGLIETSQGYLDESESAALGQSEKSKLINDAAQLGQFSFACLKDILGAEATELPHQVIRPLQRWFDDLKIEESTFFWAEHAPNYEITRWNKSYFNRFHLPHQSLIDAIADVNWPFTRITVPGRALGMLPYYALVAHEAGHAIYAKIGLDINANSGNEIKLLIDRIQARITSQLLTQNHYMAISKLVSSWVEELAADAIAHYIAGPAFYFSVFGFFQMCTQGQGIAITHPPHDLRRALLHAQLNTKGKSGQSYADVFHMATGVELALEINSSGIPTCPPANQLYQELQSTGYEPFTAAVMTETIAYVTAIYPYIFKTAGDYLIKECDELVYTPEKYKFDLDTHLEALCSLIPPIEYSDQDTGEIKPVALSSNLNVGWAALLTKLNDISVQAGDPKTETTRKMERLHTLLIKAVELAEARRSWGEAV